MYTPGRIARSLTIAAITLVGLASLHLAPLESAGGAHAAGTPFLAGHWSSLPPATITSLDVRVIPVNAGGEPTGRLLYAIDAHSRSGDLGTALVPVPALASTPVQVSYPSRLCLSAGSLHRQICIAESTTLTMAPAGAAIVMTVKIVGIGTTVSHEILAH